MRLAVAQAPAELDGLEARLNWLRAQLVDVSADLVLLPELFACGYNIGDRVRDRAESVEGPTFRAMAQLASDFDIAIHYGFSETSDDALYNAAFCVAPDGTCLTHQRKLAIPPGFERSHFRSGAECSLFTWCGVRIATLICYDAEFPETVRHVASLGAQLVLVPTALGRQWGWVAHSMIPTRAYENGVYLAYANSAGTENGLEYLGGSVIAAPDGVEEARAGDAPDILTAQVDVGRVESAQARLPYLSDRHHLKLST